jgi:hypothetical protein
MVIRSILQMVLRRLIETTRLIGSCGVIVGFEIEERCNNGAPSRNACTESS